MSQWTPHCMTAEEYAGWRQANAQTFRNDRARRPCKDCTTEFRNEALLAGACNGVIRSQERPPENHESRLVQWREYNARRKTGTRMRRCAAEVDVLSFRARSLKDEGVSYAAIGRRLGVHPTYARELALRGAA